MTASLAAPPASRRLPNSRQLIALIGVVSLALIAGAWFFELVLHLRPCKLCLEQRAPHYAAIGLALVGLVLARSARLQWFVLLGWFIGPDGCGGAAPAATGMQDFMKQLQTTRIVACSEAAWRFLGLSLAGWNALASAWLFLLAVFGLLRGRSSA